MGQTTIGNILINEKLPPDLRDYSRTVTKPELTSILTAAAASHPHRYAEIAQHLKDLGDEHAYLQGSSISYDDFKPVDVDHIYRKYEPHWKKARAIKDPLARENQLREVNRLAETEINAMVAKDMKENPNRAHLWSTIGGKGNAANIRQMLYASGNQVDTTNTVVPYMARNSFARGLTPIDKMISATGARKGIVGSFISVRDPGAFGKELFMLTNDMVTTEHDCQTQRGLVKPITDPGVLDRFLAAPAGSFKRNDLLSPASRDALIRQGIKEVTVRSPNRCQAREGVCAMCIGLLENGKMSPLGDTIGLRSAQALTEPLTQMALSAKHSGGVVGKKSAFDTIKQLMHVPENFAGGAVLSQVHGRVEKIEEAPDGGSHIFINGQMHYIDPKLGLKVKKNDHVTAGDVLSDGLINPAEIVRLKGMDAGRDYLAKALQQTYADNGAYGHPKVFETVVRSVINLGKVKDPGDHDFNVEDIVSWNQNQHKTLPVTYKFQGKEQIANSVGHRLLNDLPALKMAKGTMITENHLPLLMKLNEVHAYKKPAVIEPFMVGTESAAIHKNDWLSKLGFRRVKAGLKEDVALAKSVDIHSYKPLPAYILGSEFRHGPAGTF